MIKYQIIKSNELIAKDTYKMVVFCENTSDIKPGQFINIKVEGFSLRRPISICSIDDDTYTIIYKIFGDGTKKMSKMKSGDCIDVMGFLGNSFPIFKNQDEILIIGGGIGVPPLYEVAKRYRRLGKIVNVVLGFNDKDSIFLKDEFSRLGCNIYVATIDGSFGFKGNVIELIKHFNLNGFVYSCGPNIMLKAVESNFRDGYISKESRMACGVGVCMACVCKAKKSEDNYYRICKEGPVFKIGTVE
ncbi:dihydroorotate dehydrogenase electron transfer subunit [Helcococcus ovis]|uniref:dihydroorotate dehydrogenase electron transfer subunit n=2 Tax=Helcococcus ovis TaxID=72026 RepID=UPI0038BD5314